VVHSTRTPTATEQAALLRILGALDAEGSRGLATGALFRTAIPGEELDRAEFEDLLTALGRAGLVEVRSASFEKDGAELTFQRAALTETGRLARREELAALPVTYLAMAGRGARPKATRKRRAATPEAAPRRRKARVASAPEGTPGLDAALRAWRREEARRLGIPAFRILKDEVLLAIAAESPRDDDALLSVRGVGPKLVTRYGPQILALVVRLGR